MTVGTTRDSDTKHFFKGGGLGALGEEEEEEEKEKEEEEEVGSERETSTTGLG